MNSYDVNFERRVSGYRQWVGGGAQRSPHSGQPLGRPLGLPKILYRPPSDTREHTTQSASPTFVSRVVQSLWVALARRARNDVRWGNSALHVRPPPPPHISVFALLRPGFISADREQGDPAGCCRVDSLVGDPGGAAERRTGFSSFSESLRKGYEPLLDLTNSPRKSTPQTTRAKLEGRTQQSLPS